MRPASAIDVTGLRDRRSLLGWEESSAVASADSHDLDVIREGVLEGLATCAQA